MDAESQIEKSALEKQRFWGCKIFVCLLCHEIEEIPLNVVRDFDLMDSGDPTTPPMFSCETCGGQMSPEYYRGIHGIEYKISDIR